MSRLKLALRPAFLALATLFVLAPADVVAQDFQIAFQKLSAPDDDVEDTLSGFPPSRACPDPCQRVHYIIRIINCQSANPAGVCNNPNTMSVTNGHFLDVLPVSLPLDCSMGVTVTGTGTFDPPTCDTATNTVEMQNVTIPPGGFLELQFWSGVDCDGGVTRNEASFQYDQNPVPSGSPIPASDPISFIRSPGLSFRVGDEPVGTAAASKEAPTLPIQMGRRYGDYGIRAPWYIEVTNTTCEGLPWEALWDIATPAGCMTVDCNSLRLFLNGVPQALPAGTLCPDTVRPADFTIGRFTIAPGETARVEFQATFTDNRAIAQCCNLGYIKPEGYPGLNTSDPSLEGMNTPESTCANLGIAMSSTIDAVKIAEDAAGNPITSVQPGDEVFWHFILDSSGDITVNFDDTFPPGLDLGAGAIVEPFPSGTCTITGSSLSCTGVVVDADGTTEMTVRTTVTCDAEGGSELCNEGSISGGFPMSVPTHCPDCLPTQPANLTCVTVEAPSFEFASKSGDDASGNDLVAVGEIVTWSIQPLNSGAANASGITVRDVIPAGTSYIPGSLRLGGVALTDATDADAGEFVGGEIVVRIANLAPLDFTSGLITFQVRVDAAMGAQLCNDAAMEWAGVGACPRGTRAIPPSCLDWEPVIQPPDVTTLKSVTPTGAVDRGSVLTYSVGTCNARGAGDATNVVVEDIIPAETTYVPGTLRLDGGAVTDAVDGDDGEHDAPGNRVRARYPSLPQGECRTMEFDVRVGGTANGPILNTATTAVGGGAPQASNQVSTAVNGGGGGGDPILSLAKTSSLASGPTLEVGEILQYELTACNAPTATGAARNVVVTDPLPLDAADLCGATYVANSMRVDGIAQTDAADGDAGRFVAAPAPGGVVFDLGTLDPGECVTIEFAARVADGCDDQESVRNVASMTATATGSVQSDRTSDVVTRIVDPPANPQLLRKIGGPLVNQCPNPPTLCGCVVGLRLDPVLDDCVVGGTCSETTPDTEWLVPGDAVWTMDRRLTFYEVTDAGCQQAGDPTRLAVRKSGTDVIVSLVP